MDERDGKNEGFWDRYAKLCDFEIKATSKTAYAEMYSLMSFVLVY